MKQTNQIEIPVNKKSALVPLLIYIVMVGIGVFFIVNHSMLGSPTPTRHDNPLWILIAGIIAVLFFGCALLPLLRRILSKRAGLIINREGIIENSTGVPISVLWSDIQEIEKRNCLVVMTKNPQSYIDRVTNPYKKDVMVGKFQTFGSPIIIFADDLQMNFDDLHNLLLEKLKEYQERPENNFS